MKLSSRTRVALYTVKRRALPRIIVRYAIASILLLITGLLISATWSNYRKYSAVKDLTAQAVKSYDAMGAKETRLRSEISRLESPLGREAELRKKYGVGKPGEQVYVFLEDSR